MIEKIFVDTSALYAFINSRDPDHHKVKAYLDHYGSQLVTSNFIFDEIVTLVMARMGHDKAVFTGKTLMNPKVLIMMRVGVNDEMKAWDLFINRPDKTYSFTDCTSFVIMKRLGIDSSLTVDPHFRQEGFQIVI